MQTQAISMSTRYKRWASF